MEADTPVPPDVLEDAVGRLREALAILEAIDAANMLAELPAEPGARGAHQRAVSMLAVLRRDLLRLRCELEAAAEAQEAIARARARQDVTRRARP